MYRPIHKELSTFDWTTMTDSQIRDRGLSALRRVCYTGHRTFLRPQYAESIGKWGAAETAELVSEQAPHKAMLHVSVSALRQFKSRYRLMTRLQFERHHGPHHWTRAELSFREHARAQRELGYANGLTWGHVAPIGTACAYALATARTPLGLLPVELVLWCYLFADMLAIHGITVEDWDDLTDEEKGSIWDLGRDGAPWSIEVAARRPAVLRVQHLALEAAE